MYKKVKYGRTGFNVNKCYEGETIEDKVRRVTVDREHISDGAPVIYTERKDGVNPAYNVRTDRFEVAVESMDKVTRNSIAKRDGKPELKVIKNDNEGGENVNGTND